MINPFETTYLKTAEPELRTAVDVLLSKIPDKDKCLSLTFFGKSEMACYNNDCEIIDSVVNEHFTMLPLTGFVPQPLCDNFTFGVEITCCKPDFLEFKKFDTVRYAIFGTGFGRSLFIENVKPDSLMQNYAEQSKSVFEKINKIFRLEGFEVQNIVRQWNYIGNITNFENDGQHYQLFNDSRSEFYKNAFFEHGYPAATGISMSMNGVFVSVLAVRSTECTIIKPIDNSLQVPAYNYSESVLVNGKSNQPKTTPKFERGKYVVNGESHVFYVSGTAAIRNETSLNADDAALQTRQTIENIDFLISAENLKQHNIEKNVYLSLSSARVYVKRETDYPLIKAEVEKAWPDTDAIYMLAEVCRRELLVEIEGIAS